MNIKTWQERKNIGLFSKEQMMQAEIDELRNAGAEQRKVLEQALEALQAALSDDQQYLDPCEKAITAIQEQLK